MGFRNGAFARVFGNMESVTNKVTKGRISISQKKRGTDEYEQKFGGFVSFIGTAAANKAMKLKEMDRIRLDSVDLESVYDKEHNRTYYNFYIYDFKTQEEVDAEGESSNNGQHSGDAGGGWVDGYGNPAEIDTGDMEPQLPF